MIKTVLICDFCGKQSKPMSGEFHTFEDGSKPYPTGWGILETADKSGNGEWVTRHSCPNCLKILYKAKKVDDDKNQI